MFVDVLSSGARHPCLQFMDAKSLSCLTVCNRATSKIDVEQFFRELVKKDFTESFQADQKERLTCKRYYAKQVRILRNIDSSSCTKSYLSDEYGNIDRMMNDFFGSRSTSNRVIFFGNGEDDQGFIRIYNKNDRSLVKQVKLIEKAFSSISIIPCEEDEFIAVRDFNCLKTISVTTGDVNVFDRFRLFDQSVGLRNTLVGLSVDRSTIFAYNVKSNKEQVLAKFPFKITWFDARFCPESETSFEIICSCTEIAGESPVKLNSFEVDQATGRIEPRINGFESPKDYPDYVLDTFQFVGTTQKVCVLYTKIGENFIACINDSYTGKIIRTTDVAIGSSYSRMAFATHNFGMILRAITFIEKNAYHLSHLQYDPTSGKFYSVEKGRWDNQSLKLMLCEYDFFKGNTPKN